MIRGFYTARAGMINHQYHMDVVANNIANVNTEGYKASKVSFTDLMYQNINRNTAADTALVGHGVKINKTDLIMNPGNLLPTQYALDFTITDTNGFFAVQDMSDNITYTRAGNFILSQDEGGGYFLATGNGDRVLSTDSEPIEIQFDEDGTAIIDTAEIGVFSFSNPYGLHTVGNSRFIPSLNSGEAELLETATIMQGYLEGSSVELATEMVKVIESQRAFSFNSRVIQTADEIEQTVNSLR